MTWAEPPLIETDAVELFADRARQAWPQFRLRDDDRKAVVDICQRLDGLPLAIELAGARTRALDPTHIAPGLRERFALLQTGPHSAPRRQSTLAASSIGASTCCPMRNGLCFASSRSLPAGSTATPL